MFGTAPHRTPHWVRPGAVKHALVDGDVLAYKMAGPDSCPAPAARENMIQRVKLIERIAGAPVSVLLTMPGSEKGKRYFIATAKPYQGKRVSSRRPANWQFLRNILESDRPPFKVVRTYSAEADDLFSQASHLHDGNVLIHTNDKDMRMVRGIHLTWENLELVDTRDGLDCQVWGLQYGLRWFWLQMLQGDTVDNIPGVPKVANHKGTMVNCGDTTAEEILAATRPEDYHAAVLQRYRDYYAAGGELALLEQAMLLWMRKDPRNPFDVIDNGPLQGLVRPEVRREMESRIWP